MTATVAVAEAAAVVEINVSDVVFRQELYPDFRHSPAIVQRYAEDLECMPPIVVNQYNELIDGWHRWTAHKSRNAETIRVIVMHTASDARFLELAVELNAKHGFQFSLENRQDMARKIYQMTPVRERAETKKRLALKFSVSERSINSWLSNIDKDQKAKRDRQIFELWLSCHTLQEIAERLEIPLRTVADQVDVFCEFGNLSEFAKSYANHANDFEPQIYDFWLHSDESEFDSEDILDQLLYAHTQPFDIVLDPFAGNGSTIDICKKRFRRYFVSDLKPVVAREHEIRQHNLTAGIPKLPRWQDVKLVYLDPPKWMQAKTTDTQNLANLPLEPFNKTISSSITKLAAKLSAGAHIALVISPSQWFAPGRQYTDHFPDLACAVKLPIVERIQAPYESQQCTPQMVEWAKLNRQCLVLSREIIIWECK